MPPPARAACLRPAYARTWTALARALAGAGHPRAALEAARQVVRVSPATFKAQTHLAKRCSAAGHHEDARLALLEAIRIDPMHPFGHKLLADTLVALERFAEAEQIFAFLVEVYPRYLDGWLTLAALQAALGHLRPAGSALQKAILLRSDKRGAGHAVARAL